MNKVAIATVENLLYLKREENRRAKEGAIKKGDTEEHIQIWSDMEKLYDMLLKQMEQTYDRAEVYGNV